MSNEYQQSAAAAAAGILVPLDDDAILIVDNNNADHAGIVKMKQQSVVLRFELENLLEYIQCHSQEESVSSLEERYLLLISSYPLECLQCAVLLMSDSKKDDSLRLPIHLACDKNAPVSIIRSLLEADIHNLSVLKPDKWGDLPIHTAASRAAATSSNITDIEYRPPPLPVDGENSNDFRDILELARSNIRRERERAAAAIAMKINETIEIIRLLLEADQEKSTLYVKDVYDSLPLHTALRYNASVEVIQLLLENDMHIKNNNGNNKNNHNNQNSTTAVVVVNNTLYTEGLHGQYPLTVACRSGNVSPQVLQILLDYDSNNSSSSSKQTIFQKDKTGRLPIHIFMLRNKCSKSLQVLLESMLVGRILNVGLDIWKHQMKAIMIHSMNNSTNNLYERDFITRDKLDIICTQLELLYETCIVLELVVWKISCVIGIIELMTINNNSANDDDDNNHDSNSNDASSKSVSILTSSLSSSLSSLNDFITETSVVPVVSVYKTNRRIVSGSEIIVPNILSFLEGEPIINIVQIFQSYGYF
jgi:hypothetical protein